MQTHLYQLGSNLLLNGDSTDAEQVRHLYEIYQSIGGDKVELCLTDPPYGVKLGKTGSKIGTSSSLLKGYFQSMPIANDDLSKHDLHHLWMDAFGHVKALGISRFMTFFSWGATWGIMDVFRTLGMVNQRVLLWIKNRPAISYAEFCYQTEGILYAGVTSNLRRNKNKGQSNLFFANQPATRPTTSWYHPTSKPVELLRDLLDATTIVGYTVIDPFAGTCSSLAACHRTGRKWLGIELEPRYCLATCMRFRYETANQVPVYEILPDGERIELSDAELKSRFDAACQEQTKAKQTTTAFASESDPNTKEP